MCGRFAQFQIPFVYAEQIGLALSTAADASERYNVAPTSRVHVMHVDDGRLRDDLVPWGWSPAWAKGRKLAPINARVETVATGSFFRPIWKSGRCIVGADGWYEWKKDPGNLKVKQPYFIRLKSGAPLLFAAIGHLPQGDADPGEGDGFVILTGDADSGLVDVHDRKPLVLSPDFARSWLSPDTTPDDALHIAEHQVLSADDFEWYPVDKAVGSVRNQGPQLIEPISNPLL